MLSAIQHDDPPAFGPDLHISPALQRLVMRCLEKKPAMRFQSAGDLAFALNTIGDQGASDGPIRVTPLRSWATIAGLAIIATLLGVLYTNNWHGSDVRAGQAITASLLVPNHVTQFSPAASLAVSPDGRSLAYTAAAKGAAITLHIRSLITGEDRALEGTDGAFGPFWSPNSKTIGFFSDGGTPRSAVYKIDVASGPPTKLADAPNLFSIGAWSAKDDILISMSQSFSSTSLYRIPASGGTPIPVALKDAKRLASIYSYPDWLPDARHFIYLSDTAPSENTPTVSGVYLGDIDNAPPKLLVQGVGNAQFANGHLFWMRDQNLMMQPFDLQRLERVWITDGARNRLKL
jgi:serine/threonine protein kinase